MANVTYNGNNSSADLPIAYDVTGSATINLNNSSGDDCVWITSTLGDTINLNNSSGDDTVWLTSGAGDTVNLNNSSGDDNVSITGNGNNTVNANNSSGCDHITIFGNGNNTVNLNNSLGDDWVWITGTGSNTVNLNTSTGDDTVTIDDAGLGGNTINLNNAAGADNIAVTGNGSGTDVVNANNSTGADVIRIQSTGNAVVNLNNSGGSDTVYGGSGNITVNAQNSTGNDVFVDGGGSGTLNLGNGNDLGIYDLADHKPGDVDRYYGGGGTNTLRLILTPDESSSFSSQITALENWIGSNPPRNQTYTATFGSETLILASWQSLQIEDATLVVDGGGDPTINHSGATGVSFTVSGISDTGTGTVRFSDGTNEVDAAITGDGTYTVNLLPLNDGPISSSLTFSDILSTLTATGNIVTLDTDKTVTATLTGANHTLGSASASAAAFVVSGLDDESGSLVLSEGAHTTTIGVTGTGTYTTNLSTWDDGAVSASLTLSDAAGNSFTASTTINIDPDHGEIVSLSVPGGTLGSAGASSAAFVVSGNLDDESGSLTLSNGTSSTVIAVAGTGTYTADLSSWSDSAVTASLTVSDPVGNSFAASGTAHIDPDFGESVSLSVPGGTLGSAGASSAAFVVSGNLDDESGSLTLSNGTSSTVIAVAGTGTYTADLSSWSDSAVTASLTVSDPVGNSFAASGTAHIDPDFGESVSLSVPGGTLGSAGASSAAFVVSGNLDDESGSLTLSNGTSSTVIAVAGTGTYTANLSGWSDSAVTASLTVSDPVGNSFAASGTAHIDPDFGESVSLSVPGGTLGSAGASSAAFVVSGNLDDESGSLTLSNGTSSTVIAVAGTGTYTANLSGWSDSAVTASLTVSDPVGNSFAASGTAYIDPDFGESVSLSVPGGTLGSAGASSAAFVVSGNLDDESGSLTLSNGTSSTVIAVAGTGTYTADLSSWSDSTVTASLTVSDPVGNSFAASGTAHIDPDHGETVSISAVSTLIGSAGATAVVFAVSGLDPSDDSGSLMLTDGTASSAPVAVNANGNYTFDVSSGSYLDGTLSASLSVTDTAGNHFSASNTAAVLDKDTGLSATLTPVSTLIGSAGLNSVQYVVSGLDDETGILTVTEGTQTRPMPVTVGGTLTFHLNSPQFTDGTLSASLSMSDAAGNTFSATNNAVVLDVDTTVSVALSPASTLIGSAGASAVVYTVSGLEDETGSLTVTDGGTSTAVAVNSNGGYTFDLSGAGFGDGTLTASLTVSDPASNSFSASNNSVVLDKDATVTASLSAVSTLIGSASAAAVQYVVTGLDGETGSLTLTEGAASASVAVSGNGTYALNASGVGFADGTVTASLTVSDPAGNSFSASNTAVTLDKDLGATVALAGPGTVGSATLSAVAFAVSGLDETLGGDTGSIILRENVGPNHFTTTVSVTGNGTYTADLSTWVDGTVSATLTVTDAAGNSFSASNAAAAIIDSDAGESAVVTGPAGTLGSASASAAAFVVTTPDGDESGSLTISNGSSSTVLAVTGNGTYTANLSGWSDSTVSATLTVSDPVGNNFTASTTAVIDPDFGESAVVTGPAGTLGSASASAAKFTVTTPDGNESGSLTISNGSSSTVLAVTGNGTYTANLSAWSDSTVSATLTVHDAAGNSFTANTTAVIDPDHGESAVITGPAGTLGSASASAAAFVVTTPDGNESGSLTISNGSSSTVLAVAGNGTYTANLSGWSDSTASATLTVSDAAGNSFTANTTAVIDPDFGESAVVTGPAGTLGSASASAAKFTVTTPDGNESGSLTISNGSSSTVLAVTGNGTYTANLSGWSDSTVSATLTVHDAAGNSFTANTTAVIDPDHGDSASISAGSTLIGSASATAVKYVISGNLDGETGSLTLTDGATTAQAYTGNGTYTFDLSGGGFVDGTVTASLTVSDPAGNSFSASNTAVIDKDAGETATLTISNTTETVGAATATFTISGLDAADTGAGNTGTVSFVEGTQTVTAGVTGNGTYSASLGLSSAGTASTSLTFTDAAGNQFSASGSSITLTTVPTLVGHAVTSGNNYTSFTGTVSDPSTGTITVKIVDGAFSASTTAVESTANATLSWTINISTSKNDTVTLTAFEATGGTTTLTGKSNAFPPAGVAGSPINLALSDAGGESVTITLAGVPNSWSLNSGANLGNGTWAVTTTDPSTLAVTPPSSFAGAVVLNVSENWTNPDGSGGFQSISDNVEAYAPGTPLFAVSGGDTLTGAGNNDVFVFAQPIGNDRIFSFNAANSQVDLIGFAGIAGFSDLQIANDGNGNAVITLGSGESITVMGVGASSLTAANFLFNQEPTVANAGTMTISDGAILPLGGTINNSGTIALNSAGDGAELEVLIRGATLQGGGQVTLSDDSQNVITAGDPNAVLDNVNDTISGAGQIGAGELTLQNEGVINASGANALTIDTGSNAVVNSGTLEATGSGGMTVAGSVTNSGNLWADGGSLTVDGAVNGGTGEISGSSTLEFGAAANVAVTFDTGATGTLKLDQSGGFSGSIAGFGAGDGLDLMDIGFAAAPTLGYAPNPDGSGGTLTVSDGTHTANLSLLGQFAAAGFASQTDGHGGTIVSYVPPDDPAAPIAPPTA